MNYTIPVLSSSLPQIAIVQKQEPQKPEPIQVTVEEGMTLTSLADTHSSSVERLWQKNTQLTNADQIKPGDVITIPTADEKLGERAMISSTTSSVSQGSPPISGGLFDTTGGWCTNYAARRHPVPASFRNADTWLIDARNAGIPTGNAPQIGSIAVAAHYMHVSIVEQVDGNRVYVSEQNYNAFGVVDYRWTDASEWQGYIL